MQSKSYIIVTHSNGRRKVYRIETYLLLKRIKFIGAIVAAIAVMLLMCGMVVYDDTPIMPLQLVVMLGIGLFVLITLIYLYVSDKETCEKQSKNKKSKYRRKAKRTRIKEA